VRKHLIAIGAGASLALLMPACGGSGGASPTPSGGSAACVQASAPHHAYLVVEHRSGRTLQRCVGFSGQTIEGDTLMKQSGVEFQAATTSFGRAVCQIDQEPLHFSQCLPAGQPYWALWIDSGGAWSYAQTGYAQVRLHDGEGMGWEYVPQAGPSPSPPPLPRS
jgi:hypothetical protein